MEAEALHQLITEQAPLKLVDVRTPAEFESAHIAGAYNVPLDTLSEHRQALNEHVQSPIVLICRSGDRASRAETALKQVGMQNLQLLNGGMETWQKAELPVIRSTNKERWALERQVRLVAGSLVVIGALGSVLLHPGLVWLSAFVGAGLTFAALTDSCMMAMLLAKLPYNQSCGCDVDQVVDALKRNEPPPVA